jgi:hypothetical protein
MIYGGGGGAVIHRFLKKIYLSYTCNPISPPNFEYIKQYKYVSEKIIMVYILFNNRRKEFKLMI